MEVQNSSAYKEKEEIHLDQQDPFHNEKEGTVLIDQISTHGDSKEKTKDKPDPRVIRFYGAILNLVLSTATFGFGLKILQTFKSEESKKYICF